MKALLRLFLPAALLFPVIGCQVDPAYDFSKLDTTVTLFRGLDFPVPDAQILLKDVFSLEKDYDFIRCDGAGNYLIHLDMDPVHLQFPLPDTGSDQIPVPFEPIEYTFDAVPDLLSGKDQTVVVDLSDMLVTLTVDSDIPAVASVDATIDAIRSDKVSARCSVEGLDINYGNNEHFFVGKESPAFPDYYRVLPDLGKMFTPIPDAIRLSSLGVFMDAEQRSYVSHDQPYNISCQFSAESPIRFAQGTHFSMTAPLSAELNLDEIGLKTAVLFLTIDNTTPLDFSFRLYAYDAAGKRLDSIQVTPDFEKIPALSSIGGSITLTTAGDLRFASLSLEMTASAPGNPDPARNYLNRNQGLRLTGMSLYLPDGIQIRLDSDSTNH